MHPIYRYRVVQRNLAGAQVEIALVRERVERRLLGARVEATELLARRTLFAHDVFRAAICRSKLQEAAALAQRGELGCFVRVDTRPGGIVRVRLIERGLLGDRIVTDILDEREFQADDGDALLQASEYRGALEFRAEELNERHARERAESLLREEVQRDAAARRDEAASELAEILQSLPGDHGGVAKP